MRIGHRPDKACMIQLSSDRFILGSGMYFNEVDPLDINATRIQRLMCYNRITVILECWTTSNRGNLKMIPELSYRFQGHGLIDMSIE